MGHRSGPRRHRGNPKDRDNVEETLFLCFRALKDRLSVPPPGRAGCTVGSSGLHPGALPSRTLSVLRAGGFVKTAPQNAATSKTSSPTPKVAYAGSPPPPPPRAPSMLHTDAGWVAWLLRPIWGAKAPDRVASAGREATEIQRCNLGGGGAEGLLGPK